MSMGEKLHPASCCVSSTAGQLVAPNDCGLSVGIAAPVPIVLARETVGSWKAADLGSCVEGTSASDEPLAPSLRVKDGLKRGLFMRRIKLHATGKKIQATGSRK